jgi:hypothetical protein
MSEVILMASLFLASMRTIDISNLLKDKEVLYTDITYLIILCGWSISSFSEESMTSIGP